MNDGEGPFPSSSFFGLRTVPKPMNHTLSGVGIWSTFKQLWFLFEKETRYFMNKVPHFTLRSLTSEVPSIILEVENIFIEGEVPYLHQKKVIFYQLLWLEEKGSIFSGFEVSIMRPASEWVGSENLRRV